MIREVIYKLVRKNTSLGKKIKKNKEKARLPLRAFHVKAPGRTPGFIIWFFLKCPAVIRSSSTFPQGLCSGFWLPARMVILQSLKHSASQGKGSRSLASPATVTKLRQPFHTSTS